MSAHEIGADEFLSVAQVARRLGCSVSLVQKWRRLGWLPATRLGPPSVPVYGYRVSDVERFATERWNRRRGRPPKQPAPEQTPSTTTAAAPAPAARQEASQPPPRSEAVTTVAGGPEKGRHNAHSRDAAPPSAGPAPGAASTAARAPGPLPSARGMPAGTAPLEASAASRAPAPATTPSQPPASRPAGPTRPLTLWAGDPRERGALVLARFAPAESETAFRLAGLWARRYEHLVLGEAPVPGAPAATVRILAEWRHGQRIAPPVGATGTFGP